MYISSGYRLIKKHKLRAGFEVIIVCLEIAGMYTACDKCHRAYCKGNWNDQDFGRNWIEQTKFI
jgi:hypothetical protein